MINKMVQLLLDQASKNRAFYKLMVPLNSTLEEFKIREELILQKDKLTNRTQLGKVLILCSKRTTRVTQIKM